MVVLLMYHMTFSAMFVDFLYDHFDDPGAVHIIWSDGPSSEFKSKFRVKFFQSHTQEHKTDFVQKYFATSHGKGVDGIGGKAKAFVRAKVMSKGMTESLFSNQMIFQKHQSSYQTKCR